MTEGAAIDVAAWLQDVKRLRDDGDHLQAIDCAERGLKFHPGDLRLEYERNLAYAKAGATTKATENLGRLKASGALENIADRKLRVDFGALAGRLLKDRAFSARGPEGRAYVQAAAAAYEAVYRANGDSYPAINAATLRCIEGDVERSRTLATAAIEIARAQPFDYWAGATIAEAQVVLGDLPTAAESLRAAVAAGVAVDELATTRRQLAFLSKHLAAGTDLLINLPAPALLCWEATPCDDDPPWTREPLRALVMSHEIAGLPVLAYGAVVGPVDIAIAESIIEAGARTYLVIACERSLCIASMGARLGPVWAARLEAVLAKAHHVAEVTLEGDSAEPVVARMAAEQAQGLAAMRAAALLTTLHGVHVGPDGVTRIAMPRRDTGFGAGLPWRPGGGRISRAFVFGDVKGFSKLRESDHRAFLDYVIGGFADAIAPLRSQVEYTETAGDSVYVVLTDVIAALRCCYNLQEAMDPKRLEAVGLPGTLVLRLGAHVGPVDRGIDRVTDRLKFIGKEVIRTARIEAITPEGDTYVTEQFAASLHSLSDVGHACEYVGVQEMAKGFGFCRMYSLRPTAEILTLLQG